MFKQEDLIRNLFQHKIADESSSGRLKSCIEKEKDTLTLLKTRLKTNKNIQVEISSKKKTRTDLLRVLARERNQLLEEARDKRFKFWICGVKITWCC